MVYWGPGPIPGPSGATFPGSGKDITAVPVPGLSPAGQREPLPFPDPAKVAPPSDDEWAYTRRSDDNSAPYGAVCLILTGRSRNDGT